MNRSYVKSATRVVFGFSTAVATAALAVPMPGQYIDDPRCDPVPNTFVSHELGDVLFGFPIDEAISVNVQLINQTVCVPDDGIANDWMVRIVNLSSIPYQDLFFVTDEQIFVGNADGGMVNLSIPGAITDAFRIDGTVTITGMNDNLVVETLGQNEIFEPGESWSFMVSNFISPGNAPPLFGSIGFGGGSPGPTPSNASILANPVPEPASMGIVVCGALALAGRRRRD